MTQRPFQELLQYFAMERFLYRLDVEPDGMVFDPATVKTERIKEDADCEGVRVRFVGILGKARVAMLIDVGFGDVITPGAESITYPVLLDFPAPALSGYPRETVIAEKFHAMVYLRTMNSRMKDFYTSGSPEHGMPGNAIGGRDVRCAVPAPDRACVCKGREL